MSHAPSPARVLDAGFRSFEETWALQKQLVAARQAEAIPDTLVLVEHPDVLTLGRGSHAENLLAPGDIPVFEVERGGDVTYHGPGQLVGYPIFHLREGERDLHRYLRNLEEALILTVAHFGVTAGRNPGWTGVWTEAEPRRKLVSLGVACKKWVTYHGFALNVDTDLSRFTLINPCGLEANVMGSLSQLCGRRVDLSEVKPRVVEAFGQIFGRSFV
ncbi:MAG: lipoyl(octanoyl) transferase LipB [Myxococcales bacterium]|nr:lipoyl(octanoyl) transferase LipB [Myxococcales bacterium]